MSTESGMVLVPRSLMEAWKLALYNRMEEQITHPELYDGVYGEISAILAAAPASPPTPAVDEAKPCNFRFPISECPNMKEVDGDTSMEYEHYECKVCGKRDKLDYEEMK